MRNTSIIILDDIDWEAIWMVAEESKKDSIMSAWEDSIEAGWQDAIRAIEAM